MPQMMLISVVLPAPFGPSSANISPRLIVEIHAFERLEPDCLCFDEIRDSDDGLHANPSHATKSAKRSVAA